MIIMSEDTTNKNVEEFAENAGEKQVVIPEFYRDLKADPEQVTSRTEALKPWIGKEAVAATPLRPAGFIDIGGTRLNASTSGEFLAKGTAVRVVGAEGDHLLIRKL